METFCYSLLTDNWQLTSQLSVNLTDNTNLKGPKRCFGAAQISFTHKSVLRTLAQGLKSVANPRFSILNKYCDTLTAKNK